QITLLALPLAGVEREEQVRNERRRRQVAHLRGVRVQLEHGDERQGEQRDLVAEERDRLACPEAAEVARTQDPREAEQPPWALRCQGVGHARVTLMSPLIVFARSSMCGPSPSGAVSDTGSSERTSPERERASTQSVEPS